ncbi:MAG: iron ABC transporter permease, partial [Pseudobutyrivibrio sp.]|nr:iron ABC transporter permease [Pseudobutyrivibrio sp.]
MIGFLLVFLVLFIVYPLFVLLLDSFYTEGQFTLSVFTRVLNMQRFRTAFVNTVELGFITGIFSTIIGLLFAYVDIYVELRSKIIQRLFKVVSLLPVVSPPFVLSLSTIMLFGRSGIITRSLLHIYDSNVYGLKGIVVVQTLTFFPVCYMMLKGLLKNIDPSIEEAARDMGASRWKVFTSVTFPLMLPGIGNAFLVTFIESVADFANPMLIGGDFDTLATTIYLQVTGSYDSTGAAAMSVILLLLTLVLFFVQKYYLEKKASATLTGKASRVRMPIKDKSVTIPLTTICSLIATFVVMMYIMIPFG